MRHETPFPKPENELLSFFNDARTNGLLDNEKLKELLPIMAKDREKLSSGLSPVQTEWLDKYDDIINEMHSNAEVEAFKYGFRLATMLFIESTA